MNGDLMMLSNAEYMRQFQIKCITHRIPIYGACALTYRCNFRCIHCYLGELRNDASIPDLTTNRWCSILDQVTEAGCLSLVLTGGEPLLRKDFPEIYTYAKKRGMMVSVFTNGSAITDEIIDLFTEFPPKSLEITLYGASAKTYETITGVQGAFDQCMAGIRRLKENQMNFVIKSILMTVNRHEFAEIEKIAKHYSGEFYFDAAIMPGIDGNQSPIQWRVSPEEVIQMEFSDPKRVDVFKKYVEKRQGLSVPADRLYVCGSGQTSFYIDPYGTLQPCLMCTSVRYNLLEGTFLKGWQEVIPQIREKKVGKNYRCAGCDNIPMCRHCPPFFQMETGSEEVCSEYICQLGKLRMNTIRNLFL